MAQLFSNNAVSLLAYAIADTNTSLQVLPGTGQLYPSILSPDDFFVVTLEDQQALHREIIKVVGRANDTFTVIRGWENTTPLSWTQQTLVDLRETAGTMKRLQQVVNDTVLVSLDTDGLYLIQSSEAFAPRSTQLWIGGLRQCLGKDYIEETDDTIKLMYPFDPTDFANGVNIVLDFYRN